MAGMTQIGFSVADYTVFTLMLAVSASIGFYYAYKDRNKKNTDQFLLGGRKLQVYFFTFKIFSFIRLERNI